MFARPGHYSVCCEEGRAAAELQLMPLSASKGEFQCWDSGVVRHSCPGPQPRLLAEGLLQGLFGFLLTRYLLVLSHKQEREASPET